MNLIQPLSFVFVLFECTSNSLSQTVDFGFQGESSSGKLPSSNRIHPYTPIIIPTNGEPNTDFNVDGVREGQSVGFKFLEKRSPSTDFLDTHNSKPFGSYTRYYNHTWWNTVQEELYEMLSSKVNCTEEKPYTCFGNKTVNNKTIYELSENERLCDCDSSCGLFGYCCIDKAATFTNYDIRVQNRMHCETLFYGSYTDLDIYMIGGCPPSMKEAFEENLCLRKVEEESYEVVLDIPVHSLMTNYTYVNYYCALCNNDAESLLQMDLTLECYNHKPYYEDTNMTTLSEFLMEAKYIPGTRIYRRKAIDQIITHLKSVPKYVEISEAPEGSLHQIYEHIESQEILYRDQTCLVRVSEYENVSRFPELYGSKKCVHRKKFYLTQVSSCNSSWPVLSDIEKCHAYSLKIYDESRDILYKNPHCAKCNFAVLSTDKFSCKNPIQLFSGSPESGSGGYYSDIFKIPSNFTRKCIEKNTILNLIENRCKKIACGSGRILNKGKCIENKFENYVRNVTENSNLINKTCLTVEETNFTINDNDSVYIFSSDELLEKGDYELVNDSLILVCVQDGLHYEENFTIGYYITVVVISISLSCLAFHILLYFCYSRLRTWHGRNLLCFCISLFTAQLMLLTGTTATENSEFCVFMAACMHYFWLSCFFWMNVLSIDLWRTFKTKFSLNLNTRKVFLLYNLYSWGVPFIIVMISLTLDLVGENIKFKPNYAEGKLCWISNKIGFVCLYLLPIAIIIIENLILFIITSYNIYSKTKEAQFAKVKSQSVKTVKVEEFSEEGKMTLKNKGREEKNDKIRFALYLKLAILQGLTWVFVLLTTFINSPVLWNIFTVLNGLQGAYIVLCFDIKKWLLSSVWRKFSGIITSRSMISQDTETTTCEKGNSDGFKNSSSENVSGDSGIQSLGEKISSSKGSDNQTFFEATHL